LRVNLVPRCPIGKIFHIVCVTFERVVGTSGLNPSDKAVFKMMGYITVNSRTAARAGVTSDTPISAGLMRNTSHPRSRNRPLGSVLVGKAR
jgi:hypothetical protein